MNVTVNREALKECIGIVKTAQGTGAQNEWTKGLKIKVFNSADGSGVMTISSTDTTLSINLSIDAEVNEEGSCLINGDLIQKMVECYVDEKVSIKLDGNIFMECGRDKGDYQSMNVDDFTDMNIDGNNDGWFQIPVGLIFDADTKVRFAAADYTSAKPQMSSVYLTLNDGVLEVVACDGCKLAFLTSTVSRDFPNFSILISGETLAKVSKAIKEYTKDENIDINIKEDKVYFRIGRLLISAGLVSGKYINYKKIVPTSFNLGITFDRKELMRKIQIADIANQFSPDGQAIKDIAIKMNGEGFGQGFATIVNAHGLLNKQIGEIPFITEYGEINEDWALWVDTKYALEVLKNHTSDVIQIDVDNPNVPFSIKGKRNTDYICVVMPKQHKAK